MSKITIALEAAVATVLENLPKDAAQTNRQRVAVDRAFAQILKLIAPRIRHFVRQYGLTAHWEDAEQCCAIAVHRAIESYDPAKAQFTTFVNWQIRGELQSLRFRLMTDQRPSARKVEATTVSLSALATSPDGDEVSPEAMIEDEDAVARTEAGASDYLAEGAVAQLIDAYVEQLRKVGVEALRRRPRVKLVARGEGPRFRISDPAELEKLETRLRRDREIVEGRLFDGATLDQVSGDTGVTKARVRQIGAQATRLLTEIAAEAPRFTPMADDARRAMPPARPRRSGAAKVPLLPDPGALHNRLAHVEAIEAERTAYVTPALPVARLVLH
ncbi:MULTISPECIES: sigma factor [unclassified Sphingomonas]|jgi:RNA polymerase sigma factor (sigma-70 family)|nr:MULTISPECIES: sigma factor [unclassified Sphingomonas]